MNRVERRTHLQTALTELAHAGHQVAEALSYADPVDQEAAVCTATALGHAVCALSNLNQLTRGDRSGTLIIGKPPMGPVRS